MLNSNKITVDGNGNIILQGAPLTVNLTVNLTQIGDEAVNKTLRSFFASEVHFLLIPPPNCADSEAWKPFAETENMLVYLEQYCAELRNPIIPRITTVQNVSLLEKKEVEAYFRYLRFKTILIADMNALPEENNQHWIQIFDDYHIGGCILVGKETDKNKIFTFLNIYNKQLVRMVETTAHIRIKNIHEKEDLDKELVPIINKILEQTTINTTVKSLNISKL